MSNPQQPELPGSDAPGGPVPPENQPGHHPGEEQDKPDLDAFAERLGVVESSDAGSPAAAGAGLSAPSSRFGGALPRIAAALVAVAALVGLVVTTQRRRSRSRG